MALPRVANLSREIKGMPPEIVAPARTGILCEFQAVVAPQNAEKRPAAR